MTNIVRRMSLQNVDLAVYPAQRGKVQNTIFLNYVHGNVMALIYQLLVCQVLSMSEHHYRRLFGTYQDVLSIHATLPKAGSQTNNHRPALISGRLKGLNLTMKAFLEAFVRTIKPPATPIKDIYLLD